MKAVTTALVLIVGAAVILWYGNTLNSWVLGGLIGGFAALLLSIPISLTLFSYLSHRHDEQVRVGTQEEMALAQVYDQPRVVRRQYAVENYTIRNEGTDEYWREREEPHTRRPQAMRNLPAPTAQGQSFERLPAPQRDMYPPVHTPGYTPGYTPLPAPSVRQQAKAQGKETTVLRTTTRKMNYPGFHGHEPGSSLKEHRSQALRAARLEAARRYENGERLSNSTSRRAPALRPDPSLSEQNDQNDRLERTSSQSLQRAPRHLPQAMTNHYRSRRTIESTSPQQGTRRSLPAEGDNTGSSRRGDPQTDHIGNNYPETAPLRRLSQTDQLARNPRQGNQAADFQGMTGSLKKPLVRRAPYMYEDDPLRQELAQQLHPPAVRRSSRYTAPLNEDEEDLL